ncbi:MAG: hypothetical protein A3D31_08625 [Candidatus Fluviicola riflensis]|nr:MAG: hypothetical protein CHH17_06370 [Candidatus Fluviicola riflensis]OGS80001.1 MAG: hypothetical protein A3D31_08625 [Candidatus Fluviicola riflensis]OGS82516.1 MAG: hypothetical protein A2724_17570 [Fluviicola sp. RIFCSPHIGHO2_01_FULL_43_53]OGS88180.1 MAG: hypothetical protein A3E30_15005 [Fluviicola sp. RIFCSPHIGHO2_12_FULL_43_24]
MKENIERIIKQQLENYELPYDGGAWEQFSKRLDGTPSTPFYRKWWFAASIGTVLVSSATYFALTSTESTDDQQAPKTEQIVSTQETDHSADSKSSQNDTGSTSDAITPDNISPEMAPAPQLTVVVNPPAYYFEIPEIISEPEMLVSEPELRPHFVKLVLPSQICLNETFTIENPNDAVVTVTYPNGRTKLIQPKQSAEIKSSKSGTIQVETGLSTELITVNEASAQLYIDVDASLLYENGIPTLKFDVSGTDQAVTWESNVASKTSDKNRLVVHPYTEREVNVTANSTDANGCAVTETKTVTLNEIYNLMAPTGFYPSSGDSRTNQFIPLALTMRDTPFEMVIMDPNNMTVLYKTSDASQGWNGIDSRTGQLVPTGSTWLWKVVMKKPLSGEPSEYKGLITSGK